MQKRASLILGLLTILVGVGVMVFARATVKPQAPVAHTDSSETTQADEIQNDTPPKVESAQTETAPPPVDNGDCTKTTTKTESNDDGDAMNEEHTEVECETESGNDVNISNHTSQSAHSGDSTGQSGSATNKNDTNITVNGVPQ